MKRILCILTVVLLTTLGASCNGGQQTGTTTNSINWTPAEKEEITRTLDYYMEGSRKSDSKILAKAFAETATVSSANIRGGFSSMPIQDFYAILDNIEPSPASYTLIACSVEQDIAMLRIELELGTHKYTDMFTLVKDSNEWKIVSKVSHRHY